MTQLAADTVTFTGTAASMTLAGLTIQHSISRGDWDDDTVDALSPTAAALTTAGAHDPDDIDDAGRDCTASLDVAVADELAGILGSDTLMDRNPGYAALVANLEAALNS